MPSLKDLQKVVPNAETVAGRVIAFHKGKHLDLGQYVGDGAVVLSKDGEEAMAQQPVEKKPARKVAPNLNIKSGGLDLSDLEV